MPPFTATAIASKPLRAVGKKSTLYPPAPSHYKQDNRSAMKPNLLKKLSGRMRKRSSSDCSTRKCSLDDSCVTSCDPVSSSAQEGGCLNDSLSSRRTVDEMQLVPEQAHVAREASSSSLIAANNQVPHHLPSVDVSQPEPIQQYQYPSNQYSTTPHTHPSCHQHNPQENTSYHPTYNFNGRVSNNSSTAVVALSPPPPHYHPVIPTPEEDPSILQARKEAIEATAKLMGANHPDTLLAIQSMQKHCRNGREAAASFYSSCSE